MKALIIGFGAALVTAVVPSVSSAHFERLFLSARTFAMGGSFVAIADDATATITNPAGLTQLRGPGILTTAVRPYDVDDLEEYFASVALPTRVGAIGVSWHRFGIENVLSEDLVTVAYGRDVIRTSQDASLSFGGALDIAHVAYSGDFNESKTVLSGALSVLLRPFPVIGFGYTIRHLGEPKIDLVAGEGSTLLGVTHNFGFAYYVQRSVCVHYERGRGQDGRWRDHFGLEVDAGDHLRLRGGTLDGDVTGGIGVLVSQFAVDFGAASHEALGVSYLVTLSVELGAKSGTGVRR